MSSPLRVTDPAAVKLLTHGRVQRVLGAFLAGENTVARAAAATGIDIRTLHRDVRALCGAGLLEVVRQEARAGRPVRVYRAAAPAFFVPFSVTGAAEMTDLGGGRRERYGALYRTAQAREFGRAHHEGGGGREWGVRLYLAPEGHLETDVGYGGADLVEAAVRYQGPRGLFLHAETVVSLTAEEARAVQAELIGLLTRLRPGTLAHEAAGTGRPYLLRLGLVGVTPQERDALQRDAPRGPR